MSWLTTLKFRFRKRLDAREITQRIKRRGNLGYDCKDLISELAELDRMSNSDYCKNKLLEEREVSQVMEDLAREHGLQNLKRFSDNTLHAYELGFSRPLKWRRSFNRVSLVIRNVKVETKYSGHVYDEPLGQKEKGDTHLFTWLKPNQEMRYVVSGLVDDEQFLDRIYTIDHSEVVKPKRVRSEMKVEIYGSEARDRTDVIPEGLYFDLAQPFDDVFFFVLALPKDQ